ncbi:MAG: MurT ligase domain-containing protein [Anaerovoracaceae bacterium]|jgi:ssDNA-binding Zn-finger/Zn-ribbon topoisomerase 1
MGKLRYRIALAAAKCSVLALRITKHNGTNFPGIVALRICPDFLKYIKKPKTIYGVTGTNGKTTVSNLLNDAFRTLGKRVLNNSLGSNINTGIATALISGVTFFGREKYDLAVLEIDERSARLVFPYVHPDYLIINNLSRDSIMRNGHPEYIRNILTRYMPEETKLILNADDMLSAFTAPENERVYFAIDHLPSDKKEPDNLINDMEICPKCGSRLAYEYVRYSNIGRAYCPDCGFHAPDAKYRGAEVDFEKKLLTFRAGDEEEVYPLLNESTFNIYNEVAVLSLLYETGCSKEEIRKAIESVGITKSRYDEEKIGSRRIITMLSKDRNAYANSRVFEYLSSQDGEKEIVLMINNMSDAKKWSENVCWLYDCDFELLNDESIRNIIVTGDRGKDYVLRLLFAGIDPSRVSYAEEPDGIPAKLKLFENDQIYILYGTDVIALGRRITEKISQRVREVSEA